jgi:hypothetical protein
MRKAITINLKFAKEEVEKTMKQFVGIAPSEREANCAIDDIIYDST